MAITKNQYTGDGSTVNYTFTFEYINETDVKVEIDGVSTTAYSFANATTLTFDSAPANGAAILIYRDTDIDSLDATFFPGSAIKAEDLNSNFTQNNFAVQEIQANTWDNERDTVHSDESWISSNDQIATTAAIDARFQDELSETIESTETWVSDDDHIATTEAIDNRVSDTIDTAITNDIGTDGTGITVTDDGDGTITLGLADNAIDFSKIKDADIITYSEQNAGSPSWNSDSRIATTYASSRRFDTLVQTTTPSGTDWQLGKTWLQNDQDLTLSIWNGTNWLAIASGGAFINQPKVVYVDASSGDDLNDGHRISRPKKTIKAAVQQINSDSTYGDGSVVVVAPGVYQETAPIDITKKDVGIIGTALRSCIVHPTPATEENSLFRVNSGTFLQNLTFTGVKASGSRGGNSLDTDSTYGLPTNQGWNVSFYPGATIVKSPYIQNCTNFSDSEITNNNLDPHNPAGGAGGDTDSAPTGGGLLVDGSVVDSNSPLRSMVCDSYTHVGLDGPGIFVTNNGYAQCTSSYAFFNHYHIKCLNGGQANLAASTTDFGRYGLIADGKSPTAIFTATTTANAADEDILFTIGAPSAGAGWHGSATRPQSNMLVEIGGNIYPILSASANGSGWDVTISRPDPTDRAVNLGLNGAVSSGSAVSFYLRSMIASSGHTMEYVGSGTNYSALPENGGVPIEANQIVELNNGKVWTATTDHNGKFKVGDFFTVDQQNSSISVASGSFQVNLGTLAVDGSGNALIGAPLDLNGNSISDSTGSVTINDTLDVNGNKIVNVTDPTLAQDAATKNYVDSFAIVTDITPQLGGDLDANGNAIILDTGTVADPSLTFTGDLNTGIYSPGADQVAISTNGTQRINIEADGDINIDSGGVFYDATNNRLAVGTTSPQEILHTAKSYGAATVGTGLLLADTTSSGGAGTGVAIAARVVNNSVDTGKIEFLFNGGSDYPIVFKNWNGSTATERVRIEGSGRLLVGTSSESTLSTAVLQGRSDGNLNAILRLHPNSTAPSSNAGLGNITFGTPGCTSANGSASIVAFRDGGTWTNDTSMPGRLVFSTTADGASSPTERMRIGQNGTVTIGTTAADTGSHLIQRGSGQGQQILAVVGAASGSQAGTLFFGSNTITANTSNCVIRVERNGATTRSINAGGTVNASGSDYAEYMAKSGNFTLAKGAICGINSSGLLTQQYADSVSFIVKSTNPSYVGGDTWGSPDVIGEKPTEEDKTAIAQWEANLEFARQRVDRMAFSGQVPVNVMDATPGQYIVPVEAGDGGIIGIAKDEADLTLAEYMRAVGKVIAIEDDGRARIIVKVA